MLLVAVAVRMLHVPRPCAFHDGLDIFKAGNPAEFATDFIGGSDKARRIAGAAGFLNGFDIGSRDFFARLDHFTNGGSAAGAQIVEITFFGLQSKNVSLGEVQYVDVVAYARAIGRGVVGAKNIHRLALAESDLEDVGDEVRLDSVILSKCLRCPSRIEVTEGREGEFVNLVIPLEDGLKHEFGLTVRIDGFLRERFIQRHAVRNAKSGAGRGKDEFFNPELDDHVQEVDSRADVVAEILGGIGHRLADQRVGGEMHHGVGLDLLKNVPQDRAVSEITLVEIGTWIDCLGVTFGEIVEDRNLKTLVNHLLDTNAADVARSTRDNNFFHLNEALIPIKNNAQAAI